MGENFLDELLKGINAQTVTLIGGRWSSGNLIFYESAVSLGDAANVLTIATDGVTVGNASNDVNFIVNVTGSGTFTIDYGDSSVTLIGINMATNAPVVITDATASTTTATGALIVSGGVGIAKELYVGLTANVAGASTLTGTVTCGTHLSVPQTSYIYLDGQGGGEYIYSDQVNNLMVNATQWIDFAIAGSDKIRLEVTKLSLLTGIYLEVAENVGIQKGLIVLGNTTVAYIGCSSLVCTGNATFSGADVGIAGTLTVLTAINNGYDAAGGAVNMYADTASAGVFFDPTGNSSKGTLTITNSTVASTITGNGIGFTATVNATASYDGWALGYFGTTTLSNTTGNAANAAGGCFEVNVASAMTGGKSGLWCGAYVGAYSSSTTGGSIPTTGLWIETIPGTGVDMSTVPLISFVTSGAGTKSAIAFELGNAAAAKTVTTTSGGMYYNGTIHITANGAARYIPLSTAEGTFTTAYPIVTTSTIAQTIAALGNDARGASFKFTQATPAVSDGYAAFEIETTVSGIATGMHSALSSWVNIGGDGAMGANIVSAQQNGIWADAGGNTGSIVIFGMRAQAILTDAPTVLAPFSLNTSNREITALFEMNSNPDVGYRANASETGPKVGDVPLFCDAAGQQYFVRIYSARG